jgi:hypothetical protein
MNHVDVRINGLPAGTGWDRTTGAQFDDLARLLRPGRNVLTLLVEHRPATKEPTGVIAGLALTFTDSGELQLLSDSTWRCATEEITGWLDADFDDATWGHTVSLGRHGDAPWGPLTDPDPEFFGPQAAGIPGQIRVIYVPCAAPVQLQQLDPGKTYRAWTFDPLAGTRTSLPPLQVGADGTHVCSPPANMDHDWVLMLED